MTGSRFRSIRPYIVGNLHFTVGVSLVAGLSNAATSFWSKNLGIAESVGDLFHAFVGNAGFGLLVNFIPATFNTRMSSSSYFWLTGNLMMLGMNALMLGFNYAIQTENPVETRIIPTVASQAIENLVILRSRTTSRE